MLSSNCPIWVFMEIIGFGMLTRFYEFCIKRGLLSGDQLPTNVLNPVRSLRNACAHNNCLLNNMGATSATAPPEIISQFVAGLSDIPKVGRKKKLTCRPLLEIVCMLYAYKSIVSANIYNTGMQELKAFADGRMIKRIDYFSPNFLVTSSLEFLQKIIDNLI